MKFPLGHLAYCTNIHVAETWPETMLALRTHALAVRDRLACTTPFALGLRLSARAAFELSSPETLRSFKEWLAETNTYVFTINGFPFGSFHGRRVKEQVFLPDWTSTERVDYTKRLFRILAAIASDSTGGGSVSTLPGSHKWFRADESRMLRNLRDFAIWLDDLADRYSVDFHLGLEPEPFGHLENIAETIRFFDKLRDHPQADRIARRIGLNYDACHFAIEFDPAETALEMIMNSAIRLSKVHLSNALTILNPDECALDAIRAFDEPTYFHQVIGKLPNGSLIRYPDLPDFLASQTIRFAEARVHFHIPLDAIPPAPLGSTREETEAVLDWCTRNPGICDHYEIETYTWGILPSQMKRDVEDQIADEYRWVLSKA